jgi:hypothetical protein
VTFPHRGRLGREEGSRELVLSPLPYIAVYRVRESTDRIVRVFFARQTYPKFPVNPFDLRDIRARNRAFGCIAGITRNDRQLSGDGQPERLSGFNITAGYFRVLGTHPARGRGAARRGASWP